ncbi:MAG: winged helix-turn-helix transcriptional regulator [Thermodesulfovibrionales bacterium]
MNVQKVNVEQEKQDNYKSLLLLDEISKGEPLSQRDLSKKLNIALGLVNSYMKNLISKGFITVKNIPAKRYTYYLTPKGFAEKTRLTYHLLQDYTRIYREARENAKQIFRQMGENGVKQVAFAGVDEVAEIAYISLQEVAIELSLVADDDQAGGRFCGREIKPLDAVLDADCDCVVVTSFVKSDTIRESLLMNGVPENKIRNIFST